MQPSSSSLLDQIVRKFSSNSTDSELSSLSPELATGVTSLPGLTGILGVTAGTSVGSAWFEFILPLKMDAGVVVSGVAVLLSA